MPPPCKLISILWATAAVLPLLLLHSSRHQVDTAPIIPILTALATSAVGIFQVQVDTLHIAKYLRESASCKKNRGSFVKDLLYTTFYRSGQTHNVIVFNLGEEHRQRLYGVTFYGSVAYADGTRFGVWAFESGVFENKGARGWHNWGMIGTFKKSNGGETIYFQRRHRPPSLISSTPATTSFVSPVSNTSTEAPSWVSTTSGTTTTLKPIDILQGFSEANTALNTLVIDGADVTKNFIDGIGEKEMKDSADEGDDDNVRKVKVNISVPSLKEKTEKDTTKPSTSSKPKSAKKLNKKSP